MLEGAMWAGVLGLAVGSFLNVVALRTERGEQPTGRSHCPHCARVLSWYELIPLASYLVLRGRCRTCRTRLSLQYPLVEGATAAAFVVVSMHVLAAPVCAAPAGALSLPCMLTLALHLACTSLLVVITVCDLRTKLIPDRFSYPFAALACIALCLAPAMADRMVALLAAPALFLPFFLLWDLSNERWMGLGDAKLALGIGWFLGPAGGLSAVLYAFWIGAAVSLVQLLFVHVHTRRTAGDAAAPELTLRSEVPFGPYLVAGTALVYTTGVTLTTLVGW